MYSKPLETNYQPELDVLAFFKENYNVEILFYKSQINFFKRGMYPSPFTLSSRTYLRWPKCSTLLYKFSTVIRSIFDNKICLHLSFGRKNFLSITWTILKNNLTYLSIDFAGCSVLDNNKWDTTYKNRVKASTKSSFKDSVTSIEVK